MEYVKEKKESSPLNREKEKNKTYRQKTKFKNTLLFLNLVFGAGVIY
jgi:hypothetical protein